PFEDIEICEIKGYVPNLKDKEYVATMKQRMQDRLDYVKSLDKEMDGYNKLPKDAADAIKNVVKQANTL
nr:phosphoenolpyruvate carboxykinase [Lachnospiraceae bacterium]